MNNKILILGGGYIGKRLQEEFKCRCSNAQIFSISDAEKIVKRYKPEVLINCIGHTGRNVDECELDKSKTLFANTFIPIILAEACLRNNVRLAHISSGCIYHYDYAEDRPLSEDTPPDFFDLFYSRTKIYSERAIGILADKYRFLIVRIRIPLDDRKHPKNILSKLIRYQRVIDLPNSITYIPDFVRALRYLIDKRATGIFNLVNRGGLRYPALLKIYQRFVPEFKYEVIKQGKLKLVRTDLLLSTAKLEKTGFKARDIHEVLEECVKGYLKS